MSTQRSASPTLSQENDTKGTLDTNGTKMSRATKNKTNPRTSETTDKATEAAHPNDGEDSTGPAR